MAAAFYQKLADRYRDYYYAELGRQRLKSLHVKASVISRCGALRAARPYCAPAQRFENSGCGASGGQSAGGAGATAVQRALADMAVRELQAAASQEGGSWAPPEMARVYQDGGRYDRGIEIMKRSTPNYFAVDIPDLPRPYWEALFPRAYWSDLRKYSLANGLDPFLVASLIRQESEFNAGAISHANAVGLMQLLPKTGKTVAKQVKLKGYKAPQLYTPAVNLQLGTRYFKDMG